MVVRLMLTCLCDAFYGEVGIATVQVLEHVGCTVEFDKRQTCCGQPPFNAGDWAQARKMALHTLDVFQGETPIVTPSASCAAMLREGYHLLEMPSPPRTYELCEFLMDFHEAFPWGSLPLESKAALHRSCHGRSLNLGDTQERLLAKVPNLELAWFEDQDQCCGFGGAFSVTHPATSREIGLTKLQRFKDAGVKLVVGGDTGCFLHLRGLAARKGFEFEFKHIAEVLASTI